MLPNRREATHNTLLVPQKDSRDSRSPFKRNDKRSPMNPSKDFLAVLKICEVFLFKNKNYQMSVSIGTNSLQMRTNIYVLHTGTVLKLI